MIFYKITLPELVPELLPERVPVQALLRALPGPEPELALRALPGPGPGLPALQLPQASAPQLSCNQRLQRITSQRKALKTERIKSSSFRYHLLSVFFQSYYLSIILLCRCWCRSCFRSGCRCRRCRSRSRFRCWSRRCWRYGSRGRGFLLYSFLRLLLFSLLTTNDCKG